MRSTRFLAGAAALALAACQTTETPQQMQARIESESQAARTAIEQRATAFGQHVAAGHADSLAMMYAENASVMAPNMPTANGRDAIREMFAGMFRSGSFQLHIAVDNVVANGPLAVERGRYHLTFTPAGGGTAVPDSGKYLVHWHRMNGDWKIVDDIWNSSVPMPEPAPAPPRRR